MHAAYDGRPAEATSWRDGQFADTFRTVRSLGRGKYARVEEVEHLETLERFAVKIHEKQTAVSKQIDRMVQLPPHLSLARSCTGPLPPGIQAREFQILRLLRHPHIIRLHAAYETPTSFFMVTELAAGGDLISRLGEGNPRRFETCTEVRAACSTRTLPHTRGVAAHYHVLPSQSKALAHARALLGAVRHMHERNLAHRDLKPTNAPADARTSLESTERACASQPRRTLALIPREDLHMQSICPGAAVRPVGVRHDQAD